MRWVLGKRFGFLAFALHPRFASGSQVLPLCGAAPTCGLSATRVGLLWFAVASAIC
jgi:hypothetical protein